MRYGDAALVGPDNRQVLFAFRITVPGNAGNNIVLDNDPTNNPGANSIIRGLALSCRDEDFSCSTRIPLPLTPRGGHLENQEHAVKMATEIATYDAVREYLDTNNVAYQAPYVLEAKNANGEIVEVPEIIGRPRI